MVLEQPHLKIGIIGAGIAGSFAAFFLREACGNDVELIIFEKEEQVGGRVKEEYYQGKMFEAGASLIHSSNRYLNDAIDQLGLHRTSSLKGEKRSSNRRKLGIWNGEDFDFLSSTKALPLTLNMFSRYGSSLIKTRKMAKEAVSRLTTIYEEQSQGKAYETPEEMHRGLGLFDWAQEEAYSFFQRNGIGNRFVYEFSDGVARSNYVQGGEMNTWVTLVSLIGAGLDGGSLFSVAEGNRKICEGLIERSGARILTSTPITKISMRYDENGKQTYDLYSPTGLKENCDVIILATPFETANLEWEHVNIPNAKWLKRKYKEIHVTFITGKLNPNFFNLEREADLPQLIMTRNDKKLPFSALAELGITDDGHRKIYKMFSTEKMSESKLSEIFQEYTDVKEIVWLAYPVLTPMKEWPPFCIEKGLYYVNGMESAVSTLETEAIAAKNVVNLIKKNYVGRE